LRLFWSNHCADNQRQTISHRGSIKQPPAITRGGLPCNPLWPSQTKNLINQLLDRGFRAHPTIPNLLTLPSGSFLAIPSGQTSARNLICLLLSLSYQAQVLHPEPVGWDICLGTRITLLDNTVWITLPGDSTDFLQYSFVVEPIGSVLIVMWDKSIPQQPHQSSEDKSNKESVLESTGGASSGDSTQVDPDAPELGRHSLG
jgi:hypothetical protein